MENSTERSIVSASSSAIDSSNFHTAFEESRSVTSADDRAESGSTSGGRSEYFSARIETMMQTRSQFSDHVEHEIKFSKPHWSELISKHPTLSSEQDQEDSDGEDEEDEEEDRENWKLFEQLMVHPEYGSFFRDMRHLQLGRKIAEGGQAEIFELAFDEKVFKNSEDYNLVKVFKKGSLSQLQQQWPLAVLQHKLPHCLCGGTMLADGRFAFSMGKCWGDLRKLIDLAMQGKNNQGPPFPFEWDGKIMHDKDIMSYIAMNMNLLHKQGILHRDLKASNILFRMDKVLIVADYECSVGVVGTGFWRAPEILFALKNRDAINFTEKADVYSYAMVCFEIVTGRLPFEGELQARRASHDLVIQGLRPKLPKNLDVGVKNMIKKCWDSDPMQRPTFSKIIEMIGVFSSKRLELEESLSVKCPKSLGHNLNV